MSGTQQPVKFQQPEEKKKKKKKNKKKGSGQSGSGSPLDVQAAGEGGEVHVEMGEAGQGMGHDVQTVTQGEGESSGGLPLDVQTTGEGASGDAEMTAASQSSMATYPPGTQVMERHRVEPGSMTLDTKGPALWLRVVGFIGILYYSIIGMQDGDYQKNLIVFRENYEKIVMVTAATATAVLLADLTFIGFGLAGKESHPLKVWWCIHLSSQCAMASLLIMYIQPIPSVPVSKQLNPARVWFSLYVLALPVVFCLSSLILLVLAHWFYVGEDAFMAVIGILTALWVVPLTLNQLWTPPLQRDFLIAQVGAVQGR